MPTTIRIARPDEIDALVPLLLAAEPSARALGWSLRAMSDEVWRLDDGGEAIAAATVRTKGGACEILEIAVDASRRGQGLGKQLVAHVVAEARRRGAHEVIVGTTNASLDNIAFYQRCGFRMDRVRRDFFRYYSPPRVEHGIEVRDMLVFRMALDAAP